MGHEEDNRGFMQGNEACAEAAIAAQMKFFAAYPITPSTEIAEHLALKMPDVGGVFLQMEDELACISSIIGASWTGIKTMTATSGPGFSLMQEGIGYACMTETPIVIAHVMRGGPSTGQPTRATQADVMQVKFGSHGDYMPIALAPFSVQESYDLTIDAFNLSEKYRVPAILLSDAEIAHMRGSISIPETIELVDRKEYAVAGKGPAYAVPDEIVPPFPTFGHGHRGFVTGMTHDSLGHIAPEDGEIQSDLVRRLNDKILDNIEDICRFELVNPDAKKFMIAFGSAALAPMEIATKDPKIGLLRLKTVWPLAEKQISDIIDNAASILVIEMNRGQIVREVQRLACAGGCDRIHFFSDLTGDPPRISQIRKALENMEG